METLEMGQKNLRLPRTATLKYLKHQVNKIVLKIMMMAKIKSQRTDNNQRNQKSVEAEHSL
jgi:hypothetical protein